MVRWEIDPRRRSEPPFAVVQHVVAFIPEPRGGEVDEYSDSESEPEFRLRAANRQATSGTKENKKSRTSACAIRPPLAVVCHGYCTGPRLWWSNSMAPDKQLAYITIEWCRVVDEPTSVTVHVNSHLAIRESHIINRVLYRVGVRGQIELHGWETMRKNTARSFHCAAHWQLDRYPGHSPEWGIRPALLASTLIDAHPNFKQPHTVSLHEPQFRLVLGIRLAQHQLRMPLGRNLAGQVEQPHKLAWRLLAFLIFVVVLDRFDR